MPSPLLVLADRLKSQPQSELHLPRLVSLGIKQRLGQLVYAGGLYAVQSSKWTRQEVYRAIGGLNNAVGRYAIEIEHVIHVVIVDAVQQVGALNNEADPRATIAVEVNRFL